MKLLKTAFRSLGKFRLYTVVNIIGLAVSLACVILIARYVHQETTVNHFAKDLERVCMMTIEQDNRPTRLSGVTDINRQKDFINPLEDPAVEKFTSIISFIDDQISVADHQYNVNIFVTDSVFLQMIPYPIILGHGSMLAPEDVVITSRLAKKIFGNTNPIGQKIKYASGDILNVAGVLGIPKTKSSFNFDILVNDNLRKSWMRLPYQIVKLHDEVDITDFNKKYGEFRSLPEYHGSLTRYQLLPLRDYYFDNSLFMSRAEGMFLQGNRTNVVVLSIVALLILLVGLFNYINIYTVITLRRGREFGIKKVYGAKGWQIFGQIYFENLSMTAIAIFLAWFVLEIFRSLFSEQFALTLHPNFTFDILLSFILLLILPIITGIYPFFRYHYASPITSLRSVNVGGVSLISRSAFLFLQYVITFCLIIISIFFMKQLRFMLQADLGYDIENVVVCKILHQSNYYNVNDEEEYRKRESRHREITEIIERKMNASPLFTQWSYGDPLYSIEASLPLTVEGGEAHNVAVIYRSRKQMDLFNYQLLEGRLWDTTDIAVQYRFIINETAKKIFNIEDIHTAYLQPEHRLWYARGDMSINPAYEIVGVVKDFNTGHLSKPTTPIAIMYEDEYMQRETMMAKILSGKRSEAIDFLKELNKELYGEADFEYAFMEDEIAALYDEDKRISRIYNTFAVIAILVSCLGLFALSLFDIRQRYREIALRKVNGATTKDVLRLLLKKYIWLLAGAFVVAVPVSYLFINKYLEGFAHKAPVSWWLFAVSAVVVAGVSLLTLVWQVKKAVRIDPARVLSMDN